MLWYEKIYFDNTYMCFRGKNKSDKLYNTVSTCFSLNVYCNIFKTGKNFDNVF